MTPLKLGSYSTIYFELNYGKTFKALCLQIWVNHRLKKVIGLKLRGI